MRARHAAAPLALELLAWAFATAAQNPAALDPLPRGAQAYLAHCALCHGDTGAGDGALVPWLQRQRAPHPGRLDDAARARAFGAKGVADIVRRGGGHVGRSDAMPMWGPHLGRALESEVAAWTTRLPGLSPEQRGAVERYLASPPGSFPDGRRSYVVFCSGCHGPQGRGDGFFSPAIKARMRPGDLANAQRFAAVSDDSLRALLAPGGAHAVDAPWMPGWIHALDGNTLDAIVSYLRALQGRGEAG
jgi:mono/diheme cytochrome c family protein